MPQSATVPLKSPVCNIDPMSPQLQKVLAQAQQLNHTEQLQLITHLVNHALPISVSAVDQPAIDQPAFVDAAMLEGGEPQMMPMGEPIDPQCAEFLDEIVQYRRDRHDQPVDPTQQLPH
ncbi:MAG: hypothetical protein HC805_04280 [Alkalinema sp. RL_2_19]|nr:hypothetical protein [Alkalinema sp. RL_2_19]